MDQVRILELTTVCVECKYCKKIKTKQQQKKTKNCGKIIIKYVCNFEIYANQKKICFQIKKRKIVK